MIKTTVLNANIEKVENKLPDVSIFVKKTDYNANISNIEKKYFTTFYYNKFKFTSKILDAKKKEKELVDKSNISNLVKNSDLNTAEQDKIAKMHTYDLSCFLGKNVFGDGNSKYVCWSNNT